MAWWYIYHFRSPTLPPIDKNQVMVDRIAQPSLVPKIQQPPEPPVPKTAPKKKPIPLEKKPVPEDNMRDDSGEANGHGDANRSTDGKQPMQAEMGPQQADLMKQADDFDNDALMPASKGKPRGDSPADHKSTKLGTYQPDVVADASPVSDPKVTKAVTPAPALGVGPLPTVVAPATPAPVATGTKKPAVDAPNPDNRIPDSEAKEILGRQATVSDTESLALSRANGGVFRAGRMFARNGLTVKVKNAVLGDSAWYYAVEHGDPPTLFTVKVDADGNVIGEPEVSKSSGSSYLDHDRLLSLYFWTLMPKKDKDGHIIDDTWVIAYE